jgi:hypothetical protein
MNHREPPHLPVGVRRMLRCLSLLLLPALAPEAAPAWPRQRQAPRPGDSGSGSESLPYLTTMGAPQLRFQKALPPPDLSGRPGAAAPPVPSLSPIESTVALANLAAARFTSISARTDDVAPVTELPSETKAVPAPVKAVPPPILIDDTRPAVKPEDFLPFFQIPGTAPRAGETTVIVPATLPVAPTAAPLPPSSATYTQSK